MCITCVLGGLNNCQRNYILGKNAEKLASSTVTAAFTLNNLGYTENYWEISLEIVMDSLTEGIYYLDVRVTSDDDTVLTPTDYECPYNTYGWWWNP